ncbi:hypothetical protein ACFSSA_15785 [Luteolibacter algae]|uniref:Uncharacterized protein n=1 Tax=Luteolibacter algae TaxID=454151 RepID=A0ABW5DAN2_9BACT
MTSGKKDEFLRDFQDLLVRERVPEKSRPYYLRHLERWGVAFRQRPAGISKKDFLEEYLNKLSHTAGTEPFVVYQTAEAVRMAHEVLLGEEWAHLVDWEGYRVDRFEVPGELIVETLDKLRDVWAAMGFSGDKVDSLTALVRVMREGNYALRTEENYLQWVVRLMTHGKREDGLPGVAEAEVFFE